MPHGILDPREDTHELLGGGLWGAEGPRAWLLALLPPLLSAASAGLSATTEL